MHVIARLYQNLELLPIRFDCPYLECPGGPSRATSAVCGGWRRCDEAMMADWLNDAADSFGGRDETTTPTLTTLSGGHVCEARGLGLGLTVVRGGDG